MRRSPPKELDKAGRALWAWLNRNFDSSGTEPLAAELCFLWDRSTLAEEGVMPAAGKGKRHPLMDSEVKLSGQFMRVWRTLGLADTEASGRGPGAPTVGERMAKWGG